MDTPPSKMMQSARGANPTPADHITELWPTPGSTDHFTRGWSTQWLGLHCANRKGSLKINVSVPFLNFAS